MGLIIPRFFGGSDTPVRHGSMYSSSRSAQRAYERMRRSVDVGQECPTYRNVVLYAPVNGSAFLSTPPTESTTTIAAAAGDLAAAMTDPAAPVAVIPLDYERRPLIAGSLTYTRSALVMLFFWLLGGDFAWQFRERAIAPATQLLL